jgi:ferredoxin-thioredoxin reductase catalytic subunit
MKKRIENTDAMEPRPFEPPRKRVEKLYRQLAADAQATGYNLNPDLEFTKDLVAGLLINEKRYGYWNCPCRLSSGDKQADQDIICPCDYRDQDIAQYGSCYCALYVSDRIARGEQKTKSIPERRPKRGAVKTAPKKERQRRAPVSLTGLPIPIWRCKVCGYLCAREGPPEKCPICKVPKERFERFIG